jgi:hypothetical protein
MSVLSYLRAVRHATSAVKSRQRVAAASLPGVETLEDRTVPSTVSSIVGNFNGTAIPAGETLWFSSEFSASGLPATSPVTLHVTNGAIDFTAGGTAYHVAVPDTDVVLTPGATSAAASYDPTDNGWDVSAPSSGAGNVFMGGVELPVTANLPGGIKNVSWTASFWSDTAGVSINWRWGAAAYKTIGGDYNGLGVKPVDSKTLSAYLNGDFAGTPEAFKTGVTAGGTGGGGNNFTGNFSPNASVKPTLGDGVQDYPYPSSNPLTSIAFNESSVLVGANLDLTNGAFDVWYSDEHALALGIGTVVVKTSSGTTTTNYALSPLTSDPGSALNPAVGSTATTGDQAGTDVSGRPMAPSLFITDTTNNPNNHSGDWQWGGTAITPSAVFGTWKSFTRTVDYTTGSPAVSVTASLDPAKNGWNLGAGADAPPAGTTNAGYGAEMRWNLNDLYKAGVLIPGHTYRFYVMVHDGDQNKVGGDAGQAAFTYYYPGPPVVPGTASIAGTVFVDNNNDGIQQTGEPGLAGVLITLTGTDTLGHAVTLTATTDANGNYSFSGLNAGTYTVTETPPVGYNDGIDTLGTVNGTPNGTVGTDVFSNVYLSNGSAGINYNFAELVPTSLS